MDETKGGEEATGTSGRDDLLRHLPVFLLGLAMVVSGVWILSLTSNLTFIADEWNLLLLRQGWGVGQTHGPVRRTPDHGARIHLQGPPGSVRHGIGEAHATRRDRHLLVINALLFVYLRRRLGSWGALIGTMPDPVPRSCFRGSALRLQIGYFGSVAAGLGP